VHSTRILDAKVPLGVLIDTTSLDALLCADDEDAKTLLDYQIAKHFRFVRSPTTTDHAALERIDCFSIHEEEGGKASAVTVPLENGEAIYDLPWQKEVIQHLAQVLDVGRKTAHSDHEMARLILVAAALSRSRDTYLLVTAHEGLLRKRLWLESHIPGVPINIVTVSEAKEILDLYAKNLGKYHVCANGYCNKGLWYWYSFRSKVPHFNVEEGIMTALANRLRNLLMSIDEMGFQYYTGVNNDTMRDTLYHFYYFIILVSGIFDSLAIKAKAHYDLHFSGDNYPSRTSFNPKSGCDFLKALREKNSTLRDFINQDVDFIKVIYALREQVIHREMLRETGFHLTGSDGEWKANFIWTNSSTVRSIRNCGDVPRAYDATSEWGVYESGRNHFFDPFHFAKAAGKKLSEFVDRYLELLGYRNWAEESDASIQVTRFRAELRGFRKNRLGY